MSHWDYFPSDYRAREIDQILPAVQAGECVSVVGLSGSGKSNLLGYLAHRYQPSSHHHIPRFFMVDCNRLSEPTFNDLARLMLEVIGAIQPEPGYDIAFILEKAFGEILRAKASVCLLFDRFDALAPVGGERQSLASNLRALRDCYKYDLTYITASRRPLEAHTELAELFYAHTLWLGPLSASDARFTVERYRERRRLDWDEEMITELIRLSWAYPSFLRAACEALAQGASLDSASLAAHPAVQKRLEEFWIDQPGAEELRFSGLAGHPWLEGKSAGEPGTVQLSSPASWILTAKENLLWDYLQSHPQQVCEKDDLIRATWPEDRIFERGIRDDSLAQLVRRLREKVEIHPSSPRLIHTVPGRGYRYTPEK